MSEGISRHFDGQHYGRIFFVDRHEQVDPTTLTTAMGANSVVGKDGKKVSRRWAAVSDAEHNLIGFLIGSDRFKADWLEPQMTQKEFRDGWKRCKGDEACENKLINDALDDCDAARNTNKAECEKHCWWRFQDFDIFTCPLL